jgi:predicted flap endonuclease-1-like 5' DNA nuclease
VPASTQPTETVKPQAPKKEVPAQTTPVMETPAIQEPAVAVEHPAIPELPTNVVSSKEHALTEVSGIGEKRATQLKALGIINVDDLASVEDLAKSLKVSPKIVAKWVTRAKQLLQK